MANRGDEFRNRVVQMYLKYGDDHKKLVVNHFKIEGYQPGSIYRIIRMYKKTGRWKKNYNGGRKPKIMTPRNKSKLLREFNNQDGKSLRESAKKFYCHHSHIGRTLKKLGVKKRKKQRAPEYNEDQISLIKTQCRWLYRHFGKKSFILDDEKYFPFSGSQMPGNDTYYTKDPSTTPDHIKLKFKKKFEPKIMLYIAISDKGMSKPVFHKGGLAVNQKVYEEKCLKKVLIPFIKKYHQDNNYIFWPDKASSHYAKKTSEFLHNNKIAFVPKERNPTNLPQCRPVEDFFGYLASIVYKHGWRAKNHDQLERIRNSIKKNGRKCCSRLFQRHKEQASKMFKSRSL